MTSQVRTKTRSSPSSSRGSTERRSSRAKTSGYPLFSVTFKETCRQPDQRRPVRVAQIPRCEVTAGHFAEGRALLDFLGQNNRGSVYGRRLPDLATGQTRSTAPPDAS